MRYFLVTSILLLICISILGQASMALVIKDSSILKLNFREILKLKKGQRLLIYKPNYAAKYWDAWSKDGVFGSIDSSEIKILWKEPVWKMKTDTMSLLRQCCDSFMIQDFNVRNFDICNTCRKVLKKDFIALRDFFDLVPVLDGDLAEEHADFTFRFINYLSDNDLFNFLTKLDTEKKKIFIEYLNEEYVCFPIIGIKEKYFSKYYPKSWQIMKACWNK